MPFLLGHLQCRFLGPRRGPIHQAFCGKGFRVGSWRVFHTERCLRTMRWPFVTFHLCSDLGKVTVSPWILVFLLVKWGRIGHFHLKNSNSNSSFFFLLQYNCFISFIFKPNKSTAACLFPCISLSVNISVNWDNRLNVTEFVIWCTNIHKYFRLSLENLEELHTSECGEFEGQPSQKPRASTKWFH